MIFVVLEKTLFGHLPFPNRVCLSIVNILQWCPRAFSMLLDFIRRSVFVSWPDIRRQLGRPLETPVESWHVTRQFCHLWTVSLPSHARDRLLKVPVDITGQHIVSPLAHLWALSLTALASSRVDSCWIDSRPQYVAHFRSHFQFFLIVFYFIKLLRIIISAWLNWTWVNIAGASMHSIRYQAWPYCKTPAIPFFFTTWCDLRSLFSSARTVPFVL